MTVNEQIGKRIRELRKEKKLTQKEFGRVFGLSQNAVTNIETGKRALYLDELLKIADYFNVSTDYLIKENGVKGNNPDLQYMCDYTGLNETTVSFFHNLLSFKSRFINNNSYLFNGEEVNEDNFETKCSEIKSEESYLEALRFEKSDLKQDKRICNKMVSSGFIENALIHERRLSILYEKLSFYLALLFNDYDYLQAQDSICDEDKDTLISIVNYLNDDWDNYTTWLADEYFLELFHCQNAMIDYIKTHYSALERISNRQNAENDAQGKLTFYIGEAIQEALESDNILETLKKRINSLGNIFSQKEFQFYKSLYQEIKNNE